MTIFCKYIEIHVLVISLFHIDHEECSTELYRVFLFDIPELNPLKSTWRHCAAWITTKIEEERNVQ